jgi:hypothetical protein
MQCCGFEKRSVFIFVTVLSLGAQSLSGDLRLQIAATDKVKEVSAFGMGPSLHLRCLVSPSLVCYHVGLLLPIACGLIGS